MKFKINYEVIRVKNENYKGYTYKETEEIIIHDDRNVHHNQSEADLKNSLEKIFKQLDENQGSLKAINRQIRQILGLYDDEDESEDLEVIKLVENKDRLLADMKDLKAVASTLINAIGQNPKAIRTNFFINRYGTNSQKASDYITDKLSGENVLSDAKELIEALAFSNEAKSYTPLNLYYVQYKISKVFGIECELS